MAVDMYEHSKCLKKIDKMTGIRGPKRGMLTWEILEQVRQQT